jgi:hypothetical protein
MSEPPLNDKQCEVCGDRYSSEEPPQHPSLCPYHARTIDADTEELLEREHFGEGPK